MRIEIPYGKGTKTLTVADNRLRACLSPAHQEKVKLDQSSLVLEALENPIGSARLSDMAKGKNKVVVITSDHTRPLPSAITLPIYLKEIRKGNPDCDITILIATGVHRFPTEAEMLSKYGEEIIKNERIVIHDANDESRLKLVDTLPSGGELWLNKLVCEADLVVSEGFVEPHFFAGFSGGRKSILPGVAGRKTVLYNHNAAFIHSPNSRQGILTGNPVHRDMAFAAQAAGLKFILNVLLDGDKRIIAAFCGDPVKAHEAACRLCLDQTSVKAVVSDIAVTSNGGYPLDQNIYQCVKGLTAAESCVREGGVIILSAGLGDGHGGEAFYHWFKDRKDAFEVMKDIENVSANETHMDQWQAQILARVQQKAFCIFVTEEENKQMLEDMHMGWAGDMDAAMEMAKSIVGENATVTVIPDGVGVIVQNA